MASDKILNQLVVATVSGRQVGELADRLSRDGFDFTFIDSSGGGLLESTVSILIGLNRADLPRLLERLRECCRVRRQFLPAHLEGPFLEAQPVMIEAEVGGAAVYVLDVERFEQF